MSLATGGNGRLCHLASPEAEHRHGVFVHLVQPWNDALCKQMQATHAYVSRSTSNFWHLLTMFRVKNHISIISPLVWLVAWCFRSSDFDDLHIVLRKCCPSQGPCLELAMGGPGWSFRTQCNGASSLATLSRISCLSWIYPGIRKTSFAESKATIVQKCTKLRLLMCNLLQQ